MKRLMEFWGETETAETETNKTKEKWGVGVKRQLWEKRWEI